MEHLNYSCQDAVTGLHANVTAGSFVLLGKCLGPLTKLCQQYDKSSRVLALSTSHSDVNTEKI